MRTILKDYFISNNYSTEALTLQNLIKTSVNADPNKFYTYSNFLNNLTTDINVGNGIAPGLTSLMNGRKAWLGTQIDFTAAQPIITDIAVSNSQPSVGSIVNVTARVSNTLSAGVYLAYRNDANSPFIRIQMTDDGLHGDGAQYDNVFGASITINSVKMQYYLYAENYQAGVFSPERAEIDFYEIVTKPLERRDLVINEFLASNVSTITDQNGEYDDWIELFNNSGGVISLNNFYLSDSNSDLFQWKFPDNLLILPGNYLIVWADENNSQSGLHANFKLSASGEMIVLTNGSTGIMDSISFGLQTPDISMQRCPDGIGGFISSSPTYNNPNCVPTTVDYSLKPAELIIYPNPFSDKLTLDFCDETIKTIRIVNMLGYTVYQKTGCNANTLELQLKELPRGFYMIILNNSVTRKIFKE
jgi:hypothetical protein